MIPYGLSQMDVFRHYGDMLSVYSTQVGILQEASQIVREVYFQRVPPVRNPSSVLPLVLRLFSPSEMEQQPVRDHVRLFQSCMQCFHFDVNGQPIPDWSTDWEMVEKWG